MTTAEQAEQPERDEQPTRPGTRRSASSRRKKRLPGEVSPFGEVLTDFMSRQRPIWTTGRMARELRTRRQTIGNWIYHDITPPIETMLEIMATLGIPMSEMIAAYQRRGIAVPKLTPEAPGGEEARQAKEMRETGASSGYQAVPPQATREELERQRQREWDAMIEQTRAVMLTTGFPEQALDALLAGIQARRDSLPGQGPFSRYIASEHAQPGTSNAEQSERGAYDQRGEDGLETHGSTPRGKRA